MLFVYFYVVYVYMLIKLAAIGRTWLKKTKFNKTYKRITIKLGTTKRMKNFNINKY